MGRGNVCTHGKYEGLYFIDKDYVDVYIKSADDDDLKFKQLGELSYEELTGGEWEFDEEASLEAEDQVLAGFIQAFLAITPSFRRCAEGTYVNNKLAILENGLFYIAIEDNEWSLAVELLQKEDDYVNFEGLQMSHYQTYLARMQAALLSQLPSIGTYGGPWTSGQITRGDI